MSQKRARVAPTARFTGRNGASADRRRIKKEVDAIIRAIVEAIPPTPGRQDINPLAALAAIEGARMTIRMQIDDALAGNPDEIALFDAQLAKIIAALKPLHEGANSPGGES